MFPDKTAYIPLPVNTERLKPSPIEEVPEKVKFFIGIQKLRSIIKGTDVIYEVLQEVNRKYPDDSEILKAESIPYAEYVKMMNGSHVLIDQLYSYTPAVNALTAMAQGLVVASGAEPEYYDLENEQKLHPIINIIPDKDQIFAAFEDIILNKERIPELSRQSIEYVNKHHDYIKVAQKYVDFWESRMK